MPAHKAIKVSDRNTDRLANLAVAALVVIAAVGVTADAVARPRPASRRDDWLDDLLDDSEHPDHAADQLAHTFTPPRHPAVALPAKPHTPVRVLPKPARYRKPARPLKARQIERHSWGRVQTGPKLRLPSALTERLIRLTEPR